MRTVRGFLIEARLDEKRVLWFGPSVRGYENILTNGLVPFDREAQARDLLPRVRAGFTRHAITACLEIKHFQARIAEERHEWANLAGYRSFVVAMLLEKNVWTLIGKVTSKIPSGIRIGDIGGDLSGGALPFTRLPVAELCARELDRQTGCHVEIVNWRLWK